MADEDNIDSYIIVLNNDEDESTNPDADGSGSVLVPPSINHPELGEAPEAEYVLVEENNIQIPNIEVDGSTEGAQYTVNGGIDWEILTN